MKLADENVNKYLETMSLEQREKIDIIRDIIFEEIEGVEEKFSYGMLGYEKNGVLFYIGAWTRHIGFYPSGTYIRENGETLKKYKCGKGSIQFSLKDPIPFDLIREIILYRKFENRIS